MLFINFINKVKTNQISFENEINVYNKILACAKKIQMMDYAGKQTAFEVKNFEFSQNMSMSALFGEDEIHILYHLESMILFARLALDIISSVFSYLIFNKRIDNFNGLIKKLINVIKKNFIVLRII